MALSPELQQAAMARVRAEVATMTPEDRRGAAALARQVMPMLTSERQREIAEQFAREFEERVAGQARVHPS